MKLIQSLTAAIILALSFNVANATPVTLNHIGTSGISNVVIEDNKIGGEFPVSGRLTVGQFSMNGPDGIFGAFCVDIFNYIKSSGSYEAMTLSTGGLSDLTITRIAYLFDKYPVDGNNNVDNAVFQATLWEVLFERKPEGDSGLGLSKGTFEIESGLTKVQRKVADKMIKDVFHEASKPKNAVGSPLEFTYYKSLDGGQDLISWQAPKNVPTNNTVPEPSSLLLLGLGLLGLGVASRKKVFK